MEIPEDLQKRFKSAKRVCVLTGAGISAESGVPTFRGKDGSPVWKGRRFEAVSSARFARENLSGLWEWFDHRRAHLVECRPNLGHYALAKWENKFESFTLVTQNIDGLHRAAGSSAPIELHGNIHRAYCKDCDERYGIVGIPHKPEICGKCGGKLRPDVILFGEMLPDGAFEKAQEKATDCELFFVIGTSALVYPAASLPLLAKRYGAFVVEVNPERTDLSDLCDVTLEGKAGAVLPLIGR